MAPTCIHCNKEFAYNYLLVRHLGRKYPCTVRQETISTCTETISKSAETITKQEKCEGMTQCIYCFKTFTKRNSKRHEKTCKEQHNEIRKLEIELNKDPYIPKRLECRYCNQLSTTTSNLNVHLKTCKAKHKYYQELLEEKNSKVKHVTNNITNNNNIVNNFVFNNNITINALGKESLEHVTLEKIRQILFKNRVEYGCDGLYSTAGQSVIDFHSLMREDEANRNIIVSNIRSQTAYVMTEEGVKEMDISQALKEGVKNSSHKLIDIIKNDQDIRTGDEMLVVRRLCNVGYSLGSATQNNALKRQFKACNLGDKKVLTQESNVFYLNGIK